MPHQFTKHYTREEAQALLPSIRKWLAKLEKSRDKTTAADEKLTKMLAEGRDVGGKLVNDALRARVSFQQTLMEFMRRDIQLKDIDRGLIDFPSFVAGREVFLCWEKSESDVEFWHDINDGYAGREPL